MARQDALLRLHATLVARREELRKRLAGDYLNDMRNRAAESAGPGDAGIMGFGPGSERFNSQLAALGSAELSQIELSIRS